MIKYLVSCIALILQRSLKNTKMVIYRGITDSIFSLKLPLLKPTSGSIYYVKTGNRISKYIKQGYDGIKKIFIF